MSPLFCKCHTKLTITLHNWGFNSVFRMPFCLNNSAMGIAKVDVYLHV
jgi:hypothetical protein